MRVWMMLVVLGVLLLASCGGESGEAPGPTRQAAGERDDTVGAEPAPEARPTRPALALELLDGERFELAALRGEWVVVNFWATWCAPCLKEIPDLSQLHVERSDLTVIGLAYEDIAPQEMREFLERVPARYPIAIIDPYAEAPAGDFETPRGLPMTYLIAPDGTVARRFLGPVTSREINDAIDEHAAG